MLNSSTCIENELSITLVSLGMLIDQARKIIWDLLEVTYTGPNKLKNLNSKQIPKFFESMSGRFTRLDNVGHIPCLLVRTENKSEVGIRRGFKMKWQIRNRSRIVRDVNGELRSYSIRVYAFGEIQAGFPGRGTSEKILESAEDRKNILLSQRITWVHKEYNSYDKNYNISILISERYGTLNIPTKNTLAYQIISYC